MKKIMCFLFTFFLIGKMTLVKAEEAPSKTYVTKFDGQTATMYEKDINTNSNFSNILVNVVHQLKETQETIYTGPLGGYDNGAWVHKDFSEVHIWAVFNMETFEDEVILIIPVRDEDGNLVMAESEVVNALEKETDKVYSLDTHENISAITSELEVQTSTKKSSESIDVKFKIRNRTFKNESVQVYAAVFSDGKLLHVKTNEKSIYPWGGGTLELNVPIDYEENNVSVKLMVWNKQTMSPYCDAIELNNSLTLENELFENIEKQAEKDIKYLFKPKHNGAYTFAENTSITLYKQEFGTLVQIPSGSVLRYPCVYYVEPMTDCVLKPSRAGAFIGEAGSPYQRVTENSIAYFPDWTNGGKIYKYENENQSLVCKDSASWLEVNGEYIYYKNLLDNGEIYRVEKTALSVDSGEKVTTDR